MMSEIMDSSSEIAHVFGKPGGDLDTTMSISSDEEELARFEAALEGGIIGAEDETVQVSNRGFEAVLMDDDDDDDSTIPPPPPSMYSNSLHALNDIRDAVFQSRNIFREGKDKNDDSPDITIVFTEDQPDSEIDGGDDVEDRLLFRKFGAAERWIRDKRTRKRKLTACLVTLGVLIVLLLVIVIVILAFSLGKETNSTSAALHGSGNGLLEEGSGGNQGNTGTFDMETDAPTISSEPPMETSVPTSPLTECIPLVEATEDCYEDRIVVSFHRCGAVQDSFIGIWNEDDAKDPQRLPNPEAWVWACTGENCDDGDVSSFSGALAFEIKLPKGTYAAHMVKTEDQQKDSASSIASSQTFDVDKKCG